MLHRVCACNAIPYTGTAVTHSERLTDAADPTTTTADRLPLHSTGAGQVTAQTRAIRPCVKCAVAVANSVNVRLPVGRHPVGRTGDRLVVGVTGRRRQLRPLAHGAVAIVVEPVLTGL